MFYLCDGDIIPGEGIGLFKLDMSREDVENIINVKGYKLDKGKLYNIYDCGDVEIWFDGDRIYQISVFGDFKGKLLGELGIGSYLADIEKKLNAVSIDNVYVEVFDEMKGICFELSEEEHDEADLYEGEVYFRWRKSNLPIARISVYPAEEHVIIQQGE